MNNEQTSSVAVGNATTSMPCASGTQATPTVTELDRSQRELAQFPTLPGDEAYDIRRLHLQRNRLTTIPATIVAFRRLTYLDISNNQVHSLAMQICSLIELETLILRNNSLTDASLPKHLDRLSNLEVLNLSGNQLSQFPEKITYLTNLKQLYLGSNLITIIPTCIDRLAKLETLNLGSNRLTEVPHEVGNLHKLRTLILAENRIRLLPEGAFTQLVHLQSLQIHNNMLSLLPPEIIKLNLVELSVRNNPLVVRFVQELTFEPPSLLELAGRVIKTKNVHYSNDDIPESLMLYLNTAHQCVNPKCKGVYFTSYVKKVKFVDFCGKYHIPLMEYLCSPTCQSNVNIGISESSDSEDEVIHRMRRVLLG